MAVIGILLTVFSLIVIGGTVVLVTYLRGSSATALRDRKYKKAVAAIEIKKARAVNAGDSFGEYVANQEAIELRERYIAGKEID